VGATRKEDTKGRYAQFREQRRGMGENQVNCLASGAKVFRTAGSTDGSTSGIFKNSKKHPWRDRGGARDVKQASQWPSRPKKERRRGGGKRGHGGGGRGPKGSNLFMTKPSCQARVGKRK